VPGKQTPTEKGEGGVDVHTTVTLQDDGGDSETTMDDRGKSGTPTFDGKGKKTMGQGDLRACIREAPWCMHATTSFER
jgi:hypothetical protein